MLEKGVLFKQAAMRGEWLNVNQQKRLSQLIKQYKRDPASFDQKDNGFGQFEQLVRIWRGKKYIVTAISVKRKVLYKSSVILHCFLMKIPNGIMVGQGIVGNFK